MIVSATHRCPRCGTTWKMLANVPNAQRKSLERGERVITRACPACERKGKP